MKTLTLLRHAKSGDDGLAARDLDRRLNAKGRRAAHAIGRWLKSEGLDFDAVIASPAMRVVETIEEVDAGYGGGIAPAWERRLYLAPVDDLIEIIQATPDGVERLLLVGHNPGLEDLVLALVPAGSEGPRAIVAEKYPTASVAEIRLAVESWADVGEGRGALLRFTRPRDIDPELGPDAV